MKKSHGNDAFETDKLIERTCTQCQKEFTNKSVLARHIKTVHEQERPFKCDHCLKHFFNNNQLQVKSLCISHAVSNFYAVLSFISYALDPNLEFGPETLVLHSSQKLM